MKLRLSANETVIRISEAEYQNLQEGHSLTESFWFTPSQQLKTTLLAGNSSRVQSIENSLLVEIPTDEFQSQKTKKDEAWKVFESAEMRICVEVDLIKPPKAKG